MRGDQEEAGRTLQTLPVPAQGQDVCPWVLAVHTSRVRVCSGHYTNSICSWFVVGDLKLTIFICQISGTKTPLVDLNIPVKFNLFIIKSQLVLLRRFRLCFGVLDLPVVEGCSSVSVLPLSTLDRVRATQSSAEGWYESSGSVAVWTLMLSYTWFTTHLPWWFYELVPVSNSLCIEVFVRRLPSTSFTVI